jgi:hypothetical protein
MATEEAEASKAYGPGLSAGAGRAVRAASMGTAPCSLLLQQLDGMLASSDLAGATQLVLRLDAASRDWLQRGAVGGPCTGRTTGGAPQAGDVAAAWQVRVVQARVGPHWSHL